jgi:hypothetical protein
MLEEKETRMLITCMAITKRAQELAESQCT